MNQDRLLDNGPTSIFSREVNDLLLQRNAIDEGTQKYLHSSSTRPAHLRLPLKIHKPNNHGGPIISSNDTPTEKYQC